MQSGGRKIVHEILVTQEFSLATIQTTILFFQYLVCPGFGYAKILAWLILVTNKQPHVWLNCVLSS